MKNKFDRYTNTGKALMSTSYILMIISFVMLFLNVFKIFEDEIVPKLIISWLLIAAGIWYLCFQYFTKKEYFDKEILPHMHLPSRDLFAVSFIYTIVVCILMIFNVLILKYGIWLLSLGLMLQSVFCVTNEFGINGPKKKLGVIACVLVFLVLIMFMFVCKTYFNI